MMKPKSWNIAVDEPIIKRAQPNSQAHCLIAEAVRARIPGAWSVRVTTEAVKFNLGGDYKTYDPEATRFRYDLPSRVGIMAANFDKDRDSVKPFRFQLDARTATYAPVLWRGPASKPYQKRKRYRRTSAGRRCTERRHVGLAVVSR